MMRLLRIHITFFAICFSVCPTGTRGISNIFKNFPLFDVSVTRNDTSLDVLNVTIHQQDAREICTPPLLLHGSVDPIKSQYKSQEVIRIACKDGFELENPQSGLLYCTQKGLWKVFTLGESIYIPLPRCIVKEGCPPLPPLMQGSMQVQEGGINGLTSELSSTRAIYQCWYGLELEPPESEIRYCVQGKWTGENPQCVRASCPRPPTVQGGFFISRGVVNHVYVSGSTVKYYCDTGHQPKGPSVLTCSGKEWLPRDLPACLPSESSNAASSSNSQASSTIVVRGCSLPPEIPGGKYQILPWRRSFSSASFSPISSRVWNLNGSSSTPPLVPIYSSALYSCHRGFLTGGSSLISCTPGGWWQPTHNLPRCVPHGSSASSSSASGINLHHHGGAGVDKTKGKGFDDDDDGDDEEDEEQVPGPLLVSFTTACGVTFFLCLIWIASRWNFNCRRTTTTTTAEGQGRAGPVCQPGQQSSSSSAAAAAFFASETTAASGPSTTGRRQQRSLWTWISPQTDRGAVHQLDDDSLPAYERQLDRGQQTEQDRVALMAYMNDSSSNTSSQATLPTYEEAVRASTGSVVNCSNNQTSVYCTWPIAPPSYDSILIVDESSGNTAGSLRPAATSPVEASSNVSFIELSDETAGDSPVGTTTTSEDDEEDDADAVEGSRETLLLVPSATLDTDAITTFPTRR